MSSVEIAPVVLSRFPSVHGDTEEADLSGGGGGASTPLPWGAVSRNTTTRIPVFDFNWDSAPCLLDGDSFLKIRFGQIPDTVECTIDKNHARMSLMIAEMLDDGLDETSVIELSEVVTGVAGLVVYCMRKAFESYKIACRETGNPDHEIHHTRVSKSLRTILSAQSVDLLCEVINAANYLNFVALQSAAQHVLAIIICKFRTTDEIRSAFGVISDFSPDEMELVESTSAWAQTQPRQLHTEMEED
jgi:hypothetical protein